MKPIVSFVNKPYLTLGSADHLLRIGEIPRVVGTLSEIPGKLPAAASDVASDIVECRADLLPPNSDWLSCCQNIEALDVPVILTIRHQSEGGKWTRPESERLELYKQGLSHVSLVDVELKSEIAVRVSEAARQAGKACIVSFHDFKMTPSLEELRAIASKARKLGSIVKVSTMANSEQDIETLRTLLVERSERPLCVIAMGPSATHTRVSFSTLGSCITYGYLDQPAAPGQLAAAELVRQLRKLLPKYDADYSSRKRVGERAAAETAQLH
jgi:3-dehydroquinate dehydratase-1